MVISMMGSMMTSFCSVSRQSPPFGSMKKQPWYQRGSVGYRQEENHSSDWFT